MPLLSLLDIGLKLRQSQLLRTLEIERFAEFGRISANLLHDVSSPLTAAVLNLEQLSGKELRMVAEARNNLRQLERYVEAARLQLKSHSQLTHFDVRQELRCLYRVMEPVAKHHQLRLRIESAGRIDLYGDPVKFNQLVANLIANAIDAYQDRAITKTARLVLVTAEAKEQIVVVRVQDQGSGINALSLPLIFRSFYTTKAAGRGTGLGLATVKRIVEQDFRGSIRVSSSPVSGTCFTVRLRSANQQSC